MPLLPETKSFLAYLQQRKDVRDRIKAGRDKTLLYAGDLFAPAWREVQAFQRKQPGAVEILHDVLAKLPAPPPHLGTLQSYAEALAKKEKAANGARSERVVWRALSGIFASNAEGKVWFYTGSNVCPDTKVFALTEVAVLKRNSRISPESQDMLAYFERCVRSRNPEMNAGYLPGTF
jgi:hypothetical protein